MSTLTAFDDLVRPFGRVVESTPDFTADTPCEGWDAADVVTHVIDTQRDFLTRHDIPLAARPDVDAAPARAWAEHVAAMGEVLADDTVADRRIDGFFGPTTIGETLLRFYGFDLVVHRWDLGCAAGTDERFTDTELDLLEAAVDGFGEHLYAEGVCAPALDVADDADRQERVLARMGRRSR